MPLNFFRMLLFVFLALSFLPVFDRATAADKSLILCWDTEAHFLGSDTNPEADVIEKIKGLIDAQFKGRASVPQNIFYTRVFLIETDSDAAVEILDSLKSQNWHEMKFEILQLNSSEAALNEAQDSEIDRLVEQFQSYQISPIDRMKWVPQLISWVKQGKISVADREHLMEQIFYTYKDMAQLILCLQRLPSKGIDSEQSPTYKSLEKMQSQLLEFAHALGIFDAHEFVMLAVGAGGDAGIHLMQESFVPPALIGSTQKPWDLGNYLDFWLKWLKRALRESESCLPDVGEWSEVIESRPFSRISLSATNIFRQHGGDGSASSRFVATQLGVTDILRVGAAPLVLLGAKNPELASHAKSAIIDFIKSAKHFDMQSRAAGGMRRQGGLLDGGSILIDRFFNYLAYPSVNFKNWDGYDETIYLTSLSQILRSLLEISTAEQFSAWMVLSIINTASELEDSIGQRYPEISGHSELYSELFQLNKIVRQRLLWVLSRLGDHSTAPEAHRVCSAALEALVVDPAPPIFVSLQSTRG